MEDQLINRLGKVAQEQKVPDIAPWKLYAITTAVINALYSHIQEVYPYREADLNTIGDTLDTLKDYQ